MVTPLSVPRLVYLGDVPVESSYHGSALLYRLLQQYPVDRLSIVEPATNASQPVRRLPNVPYLSVHIPLVRYRMTRLHRWQSVAELAMASQSAREVAGKVANFQTQGVLTVAHRVQWITAARLARLLDVPLHVIVHDHPPQTLPAPITLRNVFEREMKTTLKSARSVLCVSPGMKDYFKQHYGIDASVLYPSRAVDSPVFCEPPPADGARRLTVAFAGTVNSDGYFDLLRLLNACLARLGGELRVFGPTPRAMLEDRGISGAHLQVAGLVTSTELITRLRRECDVLFVPMTFEGVGHDLNMRLSFPSKLTDYTACGLPLLICGPEYCSAVRWARTHQDAAEIVTSPEQQELLAALNRLKCPDYRRQLGYGSIRAGNRCFSYAAAAETFWSALAG